MHERIVAIEFQKCPALGMAKYCQGTEKQGATIPWESQRKCTKEVTPEWNLVRLARISDREESKDSLGEGGALPKMGE